MSILQHLLPHPCINFVTHDVWNSEILKESARQGSCLNVHESRSKIEIVQLVLCSTSTLLLGINCICTYKQWNTHYILLCILVKFIPICCCSVTKSYLTLCDPWTAAHQTPLSLTISPILLKLKSTDLVMLSNHLILCHLLLLLPSIFPSIRVFSSESVLRIRWPKYWSFSFSISRCNEFKDWFPWELTGLISLMFKRLSRVFSSTSLKASILRHSAFFMVQPSMPYMTTGKTIVLTIWTLVSKIKKIKLEKIIKFSYLHWKLASHSIKMNGKIHANCLNFYIFFTWSDIK